MRLTPTVLFLAIGAALGAPSVAAQCDWQRLASGTTGFGDQFGSSVDIQGTRLVVGARSDGDGKAFVFELVAGQWVQTATLWAPDSWFSASFGCEVALDGDTLVVGDSEYPAVYFFERQGCGWSETADLKGTDAYRGSLGNALALQGDTALIGISRHSTPSSNCGAVLVMERSGSSWIPGQLLQASDAMLDGSFGLAVALDDDAAVISGAGKMYIFERTPQGFIEIDSFDQPGYEKAGLSISGDWIFVGDPWDSTVVYQSGVVHVYQQVGGRWAKSRTLAASDAQSGDYFGRDVCVSGSRAIIGMPGDGGLNKGAAYFFELGPLGWTETVKLTSPDHWGWAVYGETVALDEQGTAIVGAPAIGHHQCLPRAYTHVLDGPDCNGNGVPDFCDLSSGTSADANGDGIPDECTCDVQRYCVANPNSTGVASSIFTVGLPSVSTNDWSLRALSCPPSQFGVFFYGRDRSQVPFGNGWRCVDGQIFRLPVVAISPAGEAIWPLDFTSPPQPEGEIAPGATWNFQFWYRDPAAGGTGFNLSSGLMVNFCL